MESDPMDVEGKTSSDCECKVDRVADVCVAGDEKSDRRTYRTSSVPSRKRASVCPRRGVRTCVLYLSHVINDESVFRFNYLKDGCQALGYGLFWALDVQNVKCDGGIPAGVDVFTYTYDHFAGELPSAVCHAEPRDQINADAGLVMTFYKHHSEEYDRLWVVEYDVCVLGGWKDFFHKYDKAEADFIAWKVRPYEVEKSWYWWNYAMDQKFLKWLVDNTPLSFSLNSICMLSFRLLRDICAFCDEIDSGSRFYEWVWATVARKSGYKTLDLESNNFSCWPIGADFKDYRPSVPYHAVKLDISWGDVQKGFKARVSQDRIWQQHQHQQDSTARTKMPSSFTGAGSAVIKAAVFFAVVGVVTLACILCLKAMTSGGSFQ